MAIYTVANAAELQAALGRAVGGDRVLLAPGDYGQVRLANYNYASTVTVQSLKNADWAHFDGINIVKSSNLQFSWLDVGRGLEGAETGITQLNSIRSSTNIRFDASRFHGSQDGDFTNDGVGLAIYDSTGVRVTGSEFTDLDRGIYVLRSNGTHIYSNDIHDLREDGINVAAANGIYISNNLIRDFHPSAGGHGDAIQFWNTGQTKGSANIAIKNNVIWMPQEHADPSLGVQGIFVTAPERYGYRNVTIENNLVYANERWNGLSVDGATNLYMVNNTLLSASNDGEKLWARIDNSYQVNMRNNVAEEFIINRTGFYGQGNNLNLTKTPSARALFADLIDPEDVSDLTTTGVGFQVPTGTIGSLLTGGLNAIAKLLPTGQVTGALETVLDDASGTIDSILPVEADVAELNAPTIHSAVVATQPVPVETLDLNVEIPFAVRLIDSFTALP